MTRQNLIYLASGILVLSMFTACAAQAERREGIDTNSTNPTATSTNSTTTQTPIPNPELKSRPIEEGRSTKAEGF